MEKNGEIEAHPNGIVPFVSYNFADYLRHFGSVISSLGYCAPKMFSVNWLACLSIIAIYFFITQSCDLGVFGTIDSLLLFLLSFHFYITFGLFGCFIITIVIIA